ncbi:hypothetical protein [Kordiimonas sediminis]|uniref:hypothetical protein n=1 Tax=Kordiimonas sediminis TaxID=1735581 RepID=UPI001748DDBB|nr:hypothetical protein [Kordiimonas sediminis]
MTDGSLVVGFGAAFTDVPRWVPSGLNVFFPGLRNGAFPLECLLFFLLEAFATSVSCIVHSAGVNLSGLDLEGKKQKKLNRSQEAVDIGLDMRILRPHRGDVFSF